MELVKSLPLAGWLFPLHTSPAWLVSPEEGTAFLGHHGKESN